MPLEGLFAALTTPPSNFGTEVYRGPAAVTWDSTGQRERVQLGMRLYWDPSPYVSLRLEEMPDDGAPRAGGVEVRIRGLRGALHGVIRWHSFAAISDEIPESIKGLPYIAQGWIDGGEVGGGRLRAVRFGVVNLPTLMERVPADHLQRRTHWKPLDGLLTLEWHGWQVVLEPLPDEHGPPAAPWRVTHVGTLTRADAAAFLVSQARMLLSGLRSLLTFARGVRTGPLLPVGIGRREHVWSLWDWEEFDRLDNGDFPTDTWLGEDHAGGLRAVFPAWMAVWSNRRWRGRLDLAVALRADAAARRADTGLVVAQQALEQLAWLLLMDDRELDQLRASDRLRRALARVGSSPDLPSGLAAVAERLGWEDGAHAVTAVRNALVHPTPSNELPHDIAALMPAWRDLALFYADTLILAFVDYEPPPE